MRLSYFPEIYPDELLYSVLGRYARHVGEQRPAVLAQDLFGDRTAIASFDLPGRLKELCQRLPMARQLDPQTLIATTTLHPYYTAFATSDARAELARAMETGTSGQHLRTGLAAFRAGRTTTLRFCPACQHEMRRDYGEAYWRRDHQLPGVLVCPEHRLPLQVSRVVAYRSNRHTYAPADPTTCPTSAPALLDVQTPNVLGRLHDIALASATYLRASPPPPSLKQIGEAYRQRTMDAGFVRSPKRIDQPQFVCAFKAFYGPSLELLPIAGPDRPADDQWLAALVRKHRRAAHPLHHILLTLFLAAHRGETTVRNVLCQQPVQFGRSPWPCRNPLAEHEGQLVVPALSWYRNRDAVVGVFTCTCGYSYTRGINSFGQLGPPRYRAYGPTLEPKLRLWINEQRSQRYMSRSARLDQKTLKGEIKKLRLVTVAKLSASDPRKACLTKAERGQVRKPKRKRRHLNWCAIDRAQVRQLQRALDAIFKESPPMRVTPAELERRLGHRDWIRKRQHALPNANAFLTAHAEPLRDFQHRRLRWSSILIAAKEQVPTPWKAIKLAGLSSTWLPVAARLIAGRPRDERADGKSASNNNL